MKTPNWRMEDVRQVCRKAALWGVGGELLESGIVLMLLARF